MVFASGCTKLGQIPPTIPLTAIRALEQDPFQSYTDSLLNLNDGTLVMGPTPQGINDFNGGQAIIAYGFHSSGYGAVVSLGLRLPDSGYEHTVTLWDSATLQVLAQAEVPTITGGRWTYVDLAIVNQAVPIVPNHGYIVGFNSLAVGNAMNAFHAGNSIYILLGLYTQHGPEPDIPIVPFTRGEITFDAYGLNVYSNPNAPLPYPSVSMSFAEGLLGIGGLVDIGYIPAP